MREIILVVEDDGDVRTNVTEILENNNFDVKAAASAKEALKILETITPDLVISDIKMPEMDGYQFIQILQNNFSSSIPFVFLTAKASHSDVRKGMTYGADDYLIKPFRANELISSVKTRLEKKKKWQNEFERIRESFALAVPHELRTPLIPILGFSDLILCEIDSMSKKEINELVEKIKSSAVRLHERVEKFILLSSLEIELNSKNNIAQLRKEQIEFPNELIKKNIYEIGEKYYRKKDIEIESLQGNAPLQMPEYFLTKIISELAENACKFSKAGTPIKIVLKHATEEFELSVHNQGFGLTPAQMKRITLFEQFENGVQTKTGSGMGLFIVKKITEIFNGNLIIDSKPESYTKVTVKLPIEKK